MRGVETRKSGKAAPTGAWDGDTQREEGVAALRGSSPREACTGESVEQPKLGRGRARLPSCVGQGIVDAANILIKLAILYLSFSSLVSSNII